jgi:UDP-N-acetylmuramoylalanine--D-glutamate ligase
MSPLSYLLESPKAQYLKAIKAKKGCVGILGKGLSGKGVANLLETLGISCHSYDEKDSKPLTEKDISATDLFVYSPGFKEDHPWLHLIKAQHKPCLGEWNVGASLWQGPFITITGTNGKTTLTEFLSAAFKVAAKEVFAVGNNGYPLCQALAEGVSPQAIALCEISSFQAENSTFMESDALLWTNISEDHLDRYGSLEAYFKAKWKLTQTLKPEASFFTEEAVLTQAKQYQLAPPLKTQVVSMPEASSTLPAAFNTPTQRANYSLAQAFWQSTGLNQSYFDRAAAAFSPLKHRLQKVATVNGVEYWNDSKGTNFAATSAALKSFDKPVYWIGGGQSKGGNLEAFCQGIAPYVGSAFLIGETASQLQALLSSYHIPASVYPNLASLLPDLHAKASPGEVALLSPGFASLDQFKSYAERGAIFERLVLSLRDQKNHS